MHIRDIERRTITMLTIAATLVTGCAADATSGGFVPEPGDEAVDPDDPPIDPDPLDEDELVSTSAPLCRDRARRLSPGGLTFVIHISRNADHAARAYRQLLEVRRLIRARDIFVIERQSPIARDLGAAFPCNRFDYIAFPYELPDAYDAVGFVDGVAVDWERSLWSHGQSWTVAKLTDLARAIRGRGAIPGVVPYWPSTFDDGHIVRASRMSYELAQIQDDCAHRGPDTFGDSARRLVRNFRRHDLSARDIGFEISLSSDPDADNHTGVERSARCTRNAYGKGARAIYLYGNGFPKLAPYFRRIAEMGLRSAR